MSTISPAQINDGDAVTAASVNNPINTIANDYNGNITNINIASGAAISADKLAGGVAGMFGAWTSFTPTLTNITLGNGTLACRYQQIGKTIHVKFSFTMGSTSAMGTAPNFTLPVTSVAPGPTNQYMGTVRLGGVTGTSPGAMLWSSTTLGAFVTQDANSTLARETAITSTVPFTWATGDVIAGSGTYEAA